MKKELLQNAVNSIEFFLDSTISTDERCLQQIGAGLATGDLIVIRNAFQAGFAERMYDCLNEFSDWKLYEGYEKHFHYHHHNIYDETLFPDALIRCHDVFASNATKKFIEHLSQRDCSGPTTFSASLYLPGDHSLPHNDFTTRDGWQRQVAFVWNLTKNWQSDWGGDFFWCKKGRWIPPTFNTLLLFHVDRSSKHLVTMVSPHAKSKRLAISGWWHGKAEGQTEISAADAGSEPELIEII